MIRKIWSSRALWPFMSDVTTLSLTFLICKMGLRAKA